MINKSPISNIFAQIARHEALGNVIEIVTSTKSTDADKDLGVMGTVTEKITRVYPEPFINAQPIDSVMRSGGAFRFSDYSMTLARDSIAELVATDKHTEFNVNGVRFSVLSVTPSPSAWEFIIRRKTAEPVEP